MKTSLKNVLKMLTVLYIDEEKNVPLSIKNALKMFTKKVFFVNNIETANNIYHKKNPNIIISEVELNNHKCFEFLHNIREYNHLIPIIVTSKMKDEKILFESIRLQLIDFLEKPLKIEEFIYALNNTAKHVLHFGEINTTFANNFKYNYISKTVRIDKKIIHLTKNEAKFLELLLASNGQLTTRQDIEFYIWDEEYITDSAFKSLLKRLRDKLGKDVIKNSSGQGYYISN